AWRGTFSTRSSLPPAHHLQSRSSGAARTPGEQQADGQNRTCRWCGPRCAPSQPPARKRSRAVFGAGDGQRAVPGPRRSPAVANARRSLLGRVAVSDRARVKELRELTGLSQERGSTALDAGRGGAAEGARAFTPTTRRGRRTPRPRLGAARAARTGRGAGRGAGGSRAAGGPGAGVCCAWGRCFSLL